MACRRLSASVPRYSFSLRRSTIVEPGTGPRPQQPSVSWPLAFVNWAAQFPERQAGARRLQPSPDWPTG